MAIVLPTNADTDLYDVQIESGGTTLTFDVYLPTLYYFDASDAGPTEVSGAWAFPANGFNGDSSDHTFESIGGAGVLKGTGTNAPASGFTIDTVSMRAGPRDLDGGPESWEAITVTPSGGWTWAKLQALHVEYVAGTYPAMDVKVYESDGGTLLHSYSVAGGASVSIVEIAPLEAGIATLDKWHYLILATGDDNDITWTPPDNFVEFLEVNGGGGDDASVGAWYAKASDIMTPTVDLVRSGAEELVGVMMVVQGADTTDFEDLAFSEGSHYVSTLNVDGTPNVTPQEIITATDDAVVIILTGNRSNTNHWGGSGTTWDVDPPTGYTIESATNVASNNTAGAPGRLKQGEGAGDAMFSWMWKTVTSAGTETPGQITGFTGNRDHHTVTFAIRPAADGGLTISPGLVSSLVTAFDPVIDTGPVSMDPGLMNQPMTEFGPEIMPPSQVMDPGLAQQLMVNFGPTIVTGPTFMDPDLLQQLMVSFDLSIITQEFIDLTLLQQLMGSFDPTISIGASFVDPDLIQQLMVIFNPTLSTGPVFINPTLVQQLMVSFDPVFAVNLGLVQQLMVSFDPSLTYNYDIDPALVSSLATAFDPSLLLGEVIISPSLVDSSAVVFDPVVDTQVFITVDLVNQTAIVYDPVVDQSTPEQFISPVLEQQLIAVFDPTVLGDTAYIVLTTVGNLAQVFGVIIEGGKRGGKMMTLKDHSP